MVSTVICCTLMIDLLVLCDECTNAKEGGRGGGGEWEAKISRKRRAVWWTHSYGKGQLYLRLTKLQRS